MKKSDYEIINGPFCKCKNIKSVTSVNDEFGYWDVCCECECKLEDGFHYYNHYDGEDHDDIDFYERRNQMATNPPKGDGHRNGAVRERSQTYNPKTQTWTKRDANTGRFMDGKKDGTPFKGVRKEK